jgi:hypothetical protein
MCVKVLARIIFSRKLSFIINEGKEKKTSPIYGIEDKI